MKKAAIIILIVLTMGVALYAFGAEKGKLDLKVGDERYVCSCSPGCKCDTISQNPGKCTCGSDMKKL